MHVRQPAGGTAAVDAATAAPRGGAAVCTARAGILRRASGLAAVPALSAARPGAPLWWAPGGPRPGAPSGQAPG
eukprot:11154496-Lingulodinium_polyedra.AAC.1